ncbi:MAG: sodium:alanine symporter family protein [Oscillospiraceae bacterium]|nr:sodium:alanine symporter family protein [Oscillospiraceae bacterium]
MEMERILVGLERALWGWPLLILLMGSGLWLTLRLRFLPIRELPAAFRLLFQRKTHQKGGVSAFGALCTALSATIGTGNIVGVATALSLGGPGALVWMELSALTGLSLKYAEGWLAVRYRWHDSAGKPWGGPFAYIEKGLGKRWQPLAKLFALLGAFAGLCGVGTFVQVGSVTACLEALLSAHFQNMPYLTTPWGYVVPLSGLAAGLLLAILAARAIRGGMAGVSRLSTILVPLMGGVYVLCCGLVLLRCRAELPELFRRMLRSAFDRNSAGAGFLGVVAAGVSRGVFSNEAGLGTAPIAAASAENVTPAEQGRLSMTAVVFDTMLICTLTGLVILATGSEGVGVSAVMRAFSKGLPFPQGLSELLFLTILTLFSFTTVIGWSCCGTACLDYLTGRSRRLRRWYLAVYVLTVAVAPVFSTRSVWTAASLCNGLMAVPNVLALLLLCGKIKDTRPMHS